MADIKVIYKNANGYDQEHSESADSVKMLSFKTANYELTDTKLGNLVDGADAADEHIHDARYYRENEHIASSAGAGDAAKPIITDAGGKIDESLLDISAITALIDHGGLTGLGDDDHTQYLLADGTRALTGIQSYNSHPTFTADTQLVDKKYVDDLHIGDEWHPRSALDYIVDNTVAPPTEVTGNVYVLSHDGGAPNAAYDGAAAGDIVYFNGTVWEATTPTTGTKLSVDDETSSVRLWNGTLWQQQFYESTTASTGLTKVGVDIQIASSAAGDGLGFSAGVLSVNVDDTTVEINADTLRVKADGINDTHIDFGTGANQVSAADIPIADSGGYTAETEVEGAIQELYGLIAQNGVEYTVAIGGVTIGFPVYISANNSVTEYGAVSNTARVIGVAATTESAASTVKVLANDTVVAGVLSGATAGDTIYWNGSALTSTLPTGGGSHVWKMGVAKNATDLHVEVEFVKRNA